MIRRALEFITRNHPMKTIIVNDAPYLDRYYMGGVFGYQIWLHHFLRADSERHLHSHPWTALSWVIYGWYREEYTPPWRCTFPMPRLRKPSLIPAKICPRHIHRIKSVCPGTWTLMIVGPKRLPNWYFIDDQGDRVEMVTSPADWYKNTN